MAKKIVRAGKVHTRQIKSTDKMWHVKPCMELTRIACYRDMIADGKLVRAQPEVLDVCGSGCGGTYDVCLDVFMCACM